MPPISFQDVPATTRVPFVYVEFDASQAVQGLTPQPFELLVIVQRLAAGTVAALIPTLVTNANQARDFFGKGSIGHLMGIALFKNNRFTKATFVALDDDGAAVAASTTCVITGPATAAGTVYFYVAGRRVTVGVTDAMTVAALRTAMIAAINKIDDMPVVATAGLGAGDLDLDALNKGEAGNDIDVRLNFFSGETLPTGIAITTPAMTLGATNPDITTVWPVLGAVHRNVWAVPYTDAANLTALNVELQARSKPDVALEAVAMLHENDTLANLVTLGDGQNGAYHSIMGSDDSPSPPWDWAAAVAGIVAKHGSIDVAAPFQTLPILGVLAPTETLQFDLQERELLLADGIATFAVDGAGGVVVNRIISTYQTATGGAPDTAFLDINTALTLSRMRYDLRTRLSTRFARHKLADDGTAFGAGQKVVTPSIARAEVITIAREWEAAGLMEDVEQFKTDLIVERNAGDPNRLDIALSPDLVNQLRVVGAAIRFLL